MKTNVTLSDFRAAFIKKDRDSFSYEGYEALYNFLNDNDEDMELDVIAIDCEFCEYANFEALQADYNSIESMDDLNDNTIVIMIDKKSFIIQSF